MPKPARFLYGLLLGVSLGIIWARLFGAAHRSSPHPAARHSAPGGARHAVLIASADERELEEATAH